MYEAAHYALAAVLAGVATVWAHFIRSMAESFRRAPRLDDPAAPPGPAPAVSVILPARNESAFIGRCLESLAAQDYPDYEVVAVDDSSDDGTGRIISEHAARDPRIVRVDAAPRPCGWMGKSWACMEGYRAARGELLLFTDADTVHARNTVSLASAQLRAGGLDAISAIPRMRALDFWTRAVLPVIMVFLHTRYSALNVNDPSKGTGYFFGSFFMMRRGAYEGVGTHEGVRGEVIEDGALGRRAKEAGYRIRMVRAEHLVSAVWARDPCGLWDALARLMLPLRLHSRAWAAGILAAVSLLLFAPFPALAASAASGGPAYLCAAAGAASSLVWAGAAVEARAMGIRAAYAALAPLGGLVVVLGLLAGAAGTSVSWRGRTYRMRGVRQGIRA